MTNSARAQVRTLPRRGERARAEPPAPPTAVEAEAAVLGALMLARRLLPEVTDQVGEEDFYRPAHGTVWQAMHALAAAGRPLDVVLVIGELQRRGELDDIGGPLFVYSLVEQVPTVRDAPHYAAEVARTAHARRRMDLGARISYLGSQAGHGDADPAVLAHLAQQLVATTASGWEPPLPLSAAAGTRLPEFPVQALPSWLAAFVQAEATATQTPPDLAGMLALAVLATAAAGRVEIEPRPGWREPLNLYIAVGMPPGSRKSTVFSDLTRPLDDFERDQAGATQAAIVEAAVSHRIAEEAARLAEQAASKHPDDPLKREEAIQLAQQAAAIRIPPSPRLLADEATPEAVTSLLALHGRIALLSPEGDVFDFMAGRYQTGSSSGPNLGVYLKGHAGDRIRIDRRGRAPEYIERPALTIGLTVQPEVLQVLASRPGFRGRGLLGRFLYSLPASMLGRREIGAAPVPDDIAHGYRATVHTLVASLTVTSDDQDEPVVLRLDNDAHELLLDFERYLERRLHPDTGDLAHLTDWAAKLPGAVCRITGLLHLATNLRAGWGQPVQLATVDAAIRLAEYLTGHALAVFDLMGVDPTVEAGRTMLDWIQRTGTQHFTRRDAHRALPKRQFPKVTDLDPPLTLLTDHGYLRAAPAPDRNDRKGGRPPSPAYLVNPLAREGAKVEARSQEVSSRSPADGTAARAVVGGPGQIQRAR